MTKNIYHTKKKLKSKIKHAHRVRIIIKSQKEGWEFIKEEKCENEKLKK